MTSRQAANVLTLAAFAVVVAVLGRPGLAGAALLAADIAWRRPWMPVVGFPLLLLGWFGSTWLAVLPMLAMSFLFDRGRLLRLLSKPFQPLIEGFGEGWRETRQEGAAGAPSSVESPAAAEINRRIAAGATWGEALLAWGEAERRKHEPPADATLDELLARLDSDEVWVSRTASEALVEKGPSAVSALGALTGLDAKQKARRFSTLGEMCSSAALEALLPGLEDDDPPTREKAAAALQNMLHPLPTSPGPFGARGDDFEWQPASPARLHALLGPLLATDFREFDDYEMRRAAVLVLGAARYRPALPALVAKLRDDGEDIAVRDWAAYALGRLNDPSAVPDLVLALGSEDTAEGAWHALSSMRMQAVELFRVFDDRAATVQHPDSDVRLTSILAYRELHSRQSAQVAARGEGESLALDLTPVEVCLTDHEAFIRSAAVHEFDWPLNVLERVSHDVAESVRQATVEKLNLVGPDAVPALTRLADHDDSPDVRESAAAALRAIAKRRALGITLHSERL